MTTTMLMHTYRPFCWSAQQRHTPCQVVVFNCVCESPQPHTQLCPVPSLGEGGLLADLWKALDPLDQLLKSFYPSIHLCHPVPVVFSLSPEAQLLYIGLIQYSIFTQGCIVCMLEALGEEPLENSSPFCWWRRIASRLRQNLATSIVLSSSTCFSSPWIAFSFSTTAVSIGQCKYCFTNNALVILAYLSTF